MIHRYSAAMWLIVFFSEHNNRYSSSTAAAMLLRVFFSVNSTVWSDQDQAIDTAAAM